MTHAGADRSSHQMGCRRRHHHTPRTLACLGTHARSTKNQARPASVVIPQGMILQAPLNDCSLNLYSSWSLDNTGFNPIRTTNMLQTDLAGAVRDTLCKRILLQVRPSYKTLVAWIYARIRLITEQPTTPTMYHRHSINLRTTRQRSILIRIGPPFHLLDRHLVI